MCHIRLRALYLDGQSGSPKCCTEMSQDAGRSWCAAPRVSTWSRLTCVIVSGTDKPGITPTHHRKHHTLTGDMYGCQRFFCIRHSAALLAGAANAAPGNASSAVGCSAGDARGGPASQEKNAGPPTTHPRSSVSVGPLLCAAGMEVTAAGCGAAAAAAAAAPEATAAASRGATAASADAAAASRGRRLAAPRSTG